MFAYFHLNKFRYNERGQLTPIFIVVIVVLLIMAMVTVNLSKVSSVKTDSSNAADAGALAAGSVMANVFNAIAQSNSEMEAAYWEFFATNSALFATALVLLQLGLAQLDISLMWADAAWAINAGCAGVCGQSGSLVLASLAEAAGRNLIQQLYVAVVMAIIVNIVAYSIGTYFHYLLIRDMAEQGRYSAIKIGHQFAFINSGIGAKLKEGDVPAGVTDPDQRRNYREEFNRFLDETIGESEETPAEYTYSWKDNQQRNHSVKVKTTIDEVDTFKLKTTILPWEGELALLYLGTAVVIAFLYSAGAALLRASCICMSCCNNPWTAAVCCPCWYGLCAVGMALLQAGIIANELAIYQLLAAWAALLIAWAGIAPGPTITDDSGNVLWATIAWIEDIDHNRRVRVDTWQEHQGADLGVWQTNYPEVHSYSVVDFRGRGEIRPPQLRHDSSVVTTDIIRAE